MRANPAWRLFWHLYLGTLAVGMIAVLLVDKGDRVLWFATHRHPIADVGFRYLTWLGDGLTVVVGCLLVALIRFRYTLILLGIGLAQLVVTALLKRVVFGNLPRPIRYFDSVDPDWLVAGVQVHGNYAFPSGHTVTAFGLCFFYALVCGKRWVTVTCWLLGIAIGLSRVYLFQHFLVDVVVGSFVGTFLTASLFYLAVHWTPFWEDRQLSYSMLGFK